MSIVLCLGTTPALQRVMVFDQFLAAKANVAREIHESASGKTINVAKVVHALGCPARLITFTGGRTGELIRRQLKQLGVPHDLIAIDTATRVCTTAIDHSRGEITEFVEEAGAISERQVATLRSKFESAITKAGVLVLSGSLAPGVPADLYAYCVQRANDLNVPTIVDAAGTALKLALPHGPLLVKPNRAELTATMGAAVTSDAAVQETMRGLIAAGPAWAAITAGGNGVLLSNGQNFWRVVPPRILPVNPIGSGDSFAAGFAVSILRGKSMLDACVTAVACGASNAMNILPGVIRLEEVARFERETQVQTV